jgi:aryl-alcohol dehydrogenase-like predicted oxidoreductase
MRVSVLGLGGGGFGGIGSAQELFGKGEDQQTAFALMDRAWQAGINYFDTANSYGGGASEMMIGAWIRSRGVREQLVLSTKVFNRMGPGPDDAGLSNRHIVRAIDDSLRRLQTDYLDLYCTHDVDPETPLEETLSALDELVRSGRVRHVGAAPATALTVGELRAALQISDRRGLVRFESIQGEYNLLNRAMEVGVLPLCAAEGLAVTPFSPTSGGWLSGKYRPGQAPPNGSRMSLRPEPYRALENDKTYRAIDALGELAGERGVATVMLALAWVITHPQVTAALIGPRRPEHFDALLNAVDLRLTAEDRQVISDRMEAASMGTRP